jgi:hypothetical protein
MDTIQTKLISHNNKIIIINMNHSEVMTPYADTDHDSGVESFLCTEESIVVKFKSGTTPYYEYTYGSAGSSNVEQMKNLAVSGDGLNSFINKEVRKLYSSHW